MVNRDLLLEKLTGSVNNWQVEIVDSTGSTNDELSDRYGPRDDAEYFVLWAEEQSSGHGRLKREWRSVPGMDITASVLFPAPVKPVDIPKISLCAGMTLTTVLGDRYGIAAQARWPNDVVTGNGKVSGILSRYLDRPNAVICGIGINVNSDASEFDFGEKRPYTSVMKEAGYKVVREELLAGWLIQFERNWSLASAENINELREKFGRISFYNGKKVKVIAGGASDRDSEEGNFREIYGTAGLIDDTGSLTVHSDDNTRYSVSIDDVIIPL